MRNYIILNNKSSNDINGLIIQELAPISKPQQRTQVETIDGRDGDIVTPLGYAAYNKKIKIGLYGNFDINEIIAYFATKGTAIFSNEPDKYYNYQILDQIDYERLVRFRVATVTMHVQPFKYSATEGTLTIDASDTVSGEGSEIALDNTAEAPFTTLRHKGNATQKTYTGKNLYTTAKSTTVGAQTTILDANSYSAAVSGNWQGRLVVKLPVPSNTDMHFHWDVDDEGGHSILSAINGVQTNTHIIQNIYHTYYVDHQNSTAFNTGENTEIVIDIYASGNNATAGTYKMFNLQLEAGSVKSDYEPYVGGTASPNPDYPQDIHVVTGEQTVKITGKNLVNQGQYGTNQTTYGLTADFAPDKITLKGTSEAGSWPAFAMFANGHLEKTRYWPTAAQIVTSRGAFNDEGTYRFAIYVNGTRGTVNSDFRYIIGYMDGTVENRYFPLTDYSQNIEVTKPINFIAIGTQPNVTANCSIQVQLEKNTTASEFEPYKGQSYVIPFGDTYLAAIGDYVDEPVKVGDTWYIRRAIGKVVLDGTEANWALANATTGYTRANLTTLSSPQMTGLCDNFTFRTGAHGAYEYIWFRQPSTGGGCFIQVDTARLTADTLAAFKAWLASNPTTVYYVLATPTDEEITDQDLIDALDDFYEQAHACKGRTHITASAQGDNAPAVLSVEVGENNESTVTNAGNTTSRPIITIYGQGDIGMYINDVQVLDIALGDEQYITLDSVAMEAYKDTTANLKNRLVTGDYSKLALNAGANKIYFTGNVTKYEISKYSRWL